MSIEIVNSVMREGKYYSVEEVADKVGVSKSYAGHCLRSLWRGMVVDREKQKAGETKSGKPVMIFFYKTKQKDLELETN